MHLILKASNAWHSIYLFLSGDSTKLKQRLKYISYDLLLQRSQSSPKNLDLSLYELSIFSQNGEDGVLQEIFNRIGISNQYFIEIGAHATEANCIFLADVLGWEGIFVDASKKQFKALNKKYINQKSVKVLNKIVTPRNSNEIFKKLDVPKDFDLLSIDIDGNDIYIWESLSDFSPRVVIIEYNSAYGADVEQKSDYCESGWDGSSHFGSSLKSFILLSEKKGYQLVHAETSGCNLFFVRNDLVNKSIFLEKNLVTSRVPNYFLNSQCHPD